MFELLGQTCRSASKAGCEFADARYLAIRNQHVMSRDMALFGCRESDDRSFGVRVLFHGA